MRVVKKNYAIIPIFFYADYPVFTRHN